MKLLGNSNSKCLTSHLEDRAADGLNAGRLSAARVLEQCHEGAAASATFYLSGPPAMLEALKSGLAEQGVAVERIRIDAWE